MADNTLMNIFSFLMMTTVYFTLAKPKLQLEMLYDEKSYKTYTKSSQIMLSIFFMTILLVQFAINSVSMVNKCGGSVSQNLGISAMITFVPWFFFMGMVMIALILFPGWKSAFSDVIGYFSVAGSANDLLADFLIYTSINDKMEQLEKNTDMSSPPPPPSSPSFPAPSAPPLQLSQYPSSEQPILPTEKEGYAQLGGGGSQRGGDAKHDMQDAASAIVKLVGNMSILINQIVPENFRKWWDTLKPLMKEKYQGMPESPELLEKKKQLFNLVVARDNIGEAFWYIYTAILLISVVQLKMATQGCAINIGQMKSNYSDYAQTQSDAAASAAATSVTYTNE